MTIIGNGLIARAFKAHKNSIDNIIFASGVSNSLENRQYKFQQEIDLIFQVLKNNKRLIYFSTTSLSQNSKNFNDYLKHKANIEKILAKENALIFRLPQLVGKTQNKNNLLPFIFNCINNEKPCTIYKNSIRNIIDIEDVVLLVIQILKNPNQYQFPVEIVNLNSISTLDIVKIFEALCKKKANYIEEAKFNNNFNIKVNDKYLNLVKKCKINFNQDYNFNLIKKYYFENTR